mgnify:CR=1 FL=1
MNEPWMLLDDMEPEPSSLVQALRKVVPKIVRDINRQTTIVDGVEVSDAELDDMGIGGSRTVAPRLGTQWHPPGYNHSQASMLDEPSARTSVTQAIKSDIKKQGADLDPNRVARTAVRAIRNVDDKVFEAAGINPKYHRENFTKIIDEIMKSL